MRSGKKIEGSLAFVAQGQVDHAPILFACMPLQKTESLTPRRERDDSVMFGLKPLGQPAYGGQLPLRETLDLQQELVLKWSQSAVSRQALAVPKKSAQIVAKVSERPILLLRHIGSFRSFLHKPSYQNSAPC